MLRSASIACRQSSGRPDPVFSNRKNPSKSEDRSDGGRKRGKREWEEDEIKGEKGREEEEETKMGLKERKIKREEEDGMKGKREEKKAFTFLVTS
jgi:hypothetical protein